MHLRSLLPPPALVVAALPGAGELLTVFLWFAAVAVAGVCGFYLAMRVRKWAQRDERVGNFALQDLRDLRARGQISEQEFAALRAALLSELQIAPDAARPPLPEPLRAPPSAPPPDDDAAPSESDAPPPEGPPSPP
jgi:hypothetical protein